MVLVRYLMLTWIIAWLSTAQGTLVMRQPAGSGQVHPCYQHAEHHQMTSSNILHAHVKVCTCMNSLFMLRYLTLTSWPCRR